MDRIILASASPRRSELLRQAGFAFTVIPSRGEEAITTSHPAEVVEELSLQKAKEVAGRILEGTESVKDFSVVIGADTVVAADHRILGKPADHSDARRMIEMLQGNVHQVYTGVTLIVKDAEGNIRTATFHERTDVDVCEMTKEEIEAYIDTEEPYDKAGAYGIQGSFGIYIRGIRGCYYNVVGLPISRLYHELKNAGASC
jgi:septum formation protein